jgi:hypothetical protein
MEQNVEFAELDRQRRPPDYNSGMTKTRPIFPGPRTARGAVLAVLLSSGDQTGGEPLRSRLTLAAIVKALKRKYHWPIETTSFPSSTPDGRATWATVYSLPADVIHAALQDGGRDWLQSRTSKARAS